MASRHAGTALVVGSGFFSLALKYGLRIDLTVTQRRIGHERHIMSYCISSGESFNMVLNYIDHSDPSSWKPGKEVEEMRAVFEGWDPRYAI